MEIRYWIHEWSEEALAAIEGTCGAAVLVKTPIKMYMTIKIPVVLNRVFKKFDTSSPPLMGSRRCTSCPHTHSATPVGMPGSRGRSHRGRPGGKPRVQGVLPLSLIYLRSEGCHAEWPPVHCPVQSRAA